MAKVKAGEKTPKKSGAGRPAKATKGRTFGVRMDGPYLDWITRFADQERASVATLIDQAVAFYAKERGVEEPPKRI